MLQITKIDDMVTGRERSELGEKLLKAFKDMGINNPGRIDNLDELYSQSKTTSVAELARQYAEEHNLLKTNDALRLLKETSKDGRINSKYWAKVLNIPPKLLIEALIACPKITVSGKRAGTRYKWHGSSPIMSDSRMFLDLVKEMKEVTLSPKQNTLIRQKVHLNANEKELRTMFDSKYWYKAISYFRIVNKNPITKKKNVSEEHIVTTAEFRSIPKAPLTKEINEGHEVSNDEEAVIHMSKTVREAIKMATLRTEIAELEVQNLKDEIAKKDALITSMKQLINLMTKEDEKL